MVKELGLADLSEEMITLQAKIYVKQNNLDRALQSITSQKTYLSTKIGISVLKILAQIYQKKGEYKQSAFYYEKYNLKNDSIQKINQDNRIAQVTKSPFYELRELELKNKQNLKEDELKQVIAEKQEMASRLWLIISFVGLLITLSILFSFSLKRKNKSLKNQRLKIDKLMVMQEEVIELRTSELLSSKNTISRYAFHNTHELRAPLSKIQGIINFSNKEDIGGEDFFRSLKVSAEELELAIREISSALHKKS